MSLRSRTSFLALTGAVLFAAPVRAQSDAGSPAQHEVSASPVTAEAPPPPAPFETRIRARRPSTAASSQVVRDEDLRLRPLSDASDVLEVTPGLFTVQHAGGGKANQYFLRGFDADHGTDVALSVDEVPANMVSHGHGQGYTDLHFVIPELVERLEVTKGPYLASQGDFATAGAVNLVLRRRLERSEVTVSAGRFNTFRALLLAALGAEGPVDGYLAAEVYGSDGPFLLQERLRRLNLSGTATWELAPGAEATLQVQSYAGGWRASGQLPSRRVEAGQLERFGTLDPTDGGGSQRHAARLALVRRGAGGSELRLMAYAVRYQLNLFSNFTFFAADPVNGDQILQTDARTLAGLEGRYTRGLSLGSVELLTSGGIRVRSDGIDNTLAHTVRREVLAPRVDARVDEASLGAWTELDATWTPWLRTVLGLRADLFNAAVRDRLEDTAVLGNATSGTAQALRMSPKASVVLSPADSLDVFLNFGQGFHSNDARGWVRAQAPVTPLTGATGYEVGVRARPLPGLDVAASVWALDLQSETVWVGDEGTTEERGPTHRRGVEVEARYRVTPWLRADADVTLTRARFVEDTGAGTRVPLAPRLTASAGLTAEHPSGVFGSLRAGGMGDRPANEDGSLTARGFWLVNAEAGYQSQRFRVALEARNLLDATWEEAQFANESRLPDEDAPIEDVHFTPGAPRALRLSASFFF